jgi:predicted  nucleic acid-binding Zn-ribbon protein
MSEQCLKNHQLHIKELQETNQRLNTNVEQLGETLYQEKSLFKKVQIEVQQLKQSIIQDKSQINELQTETQREKTEITRVDERCTKHEIQINHLSDKINGKEGK